MENPSIDIRDVHKTYAGNVRALRGVQLRTGRGEVFGLLGPNGAGKSTLVKILLTIVRPDRAGGTLLGEPIGRRSALARVGYLPENIRVPAHLTGAQALTFYAALAKVPGPERARRAATWLERLGLGPWTAKRVGSYSKGMLQRLGIAQALMNDPDLVFLDEPTDGLDPLGRRDVRELLIELRKAGKTVFINSHILSELEMVCDRVAILVAGQVAREGTVADLTRATVTYRIRISGDLAPARADVERSGGRIDGAAIVVDGDDTHAMNAIIDALRRRGALIQSVVPERFSLEDVFVQAVEARAAAPSAPGKRIR
jgi:ABC-2 type transport system ATP-binding protein